MAPGRIDTTHPSSFQLIKPLLCPFIFPAPFDFFLLLLLLLLLHNLESVYHLYSNKTVDRFVSANVKHKIV